MSKVGSHVLFRVPEAHHATTEEKHAGQKEPIVHEGSIYHRKRREFAGLITDEHEPVEGGKKAKPTYDLIIFPPGKAPVHVEGVSEGKDAGEITIL